MTIFYIILLCTALHPPYQKGETPFYYLLLAMVGLYNLLLAMMGFYYLLLAMMGLFVQCRPTFGISAISFRRKRTWVGTLMWKSAKMTRRTQ